MSQPWFKMYPGKHYEIVFSDGGSLKFKCTGGQLDESNGKPINLIAELQGVNTNECEVYETDKTGHSRLVRVA